MDIFFASVGFEGGNKI